MSRRNGFCERAIYLGYNVVILRDYGLGKGIMSKGPPLENDFDKSYDCIDWNFITSKLACLDFGER